MAKGGFRGGSYGGGGMNMNMIKQAQKMQAEMMKMQAEMEEKTHTAKAGGAQNPQQPFRREIVHMESPLS